MKNTELLYRVKIKQLMIVVLFVLSIKSGYTQWPSVDKMIKSHYLPSLEVKIHAPDEYQPKVQAEIAKLESDREKAERKFMQTLEKDYNNELNSAAEKIEKTIKEAVSIFEDKNLLNKSAEYAINPPMIMVNKDSKKNNQPSFREIADFSMSTIQKDTLAALVDDDNKLEKFRNAKVSISLGDGLLNNNNTQESFIQKSEAKQNNQPHNKNKDNGELQNGPIDLDDESPFTSFLELKEDGKYSKPISVVMKLPSEPDGKIKSEIEKIEKERADHEKKMFTKAKEEFKLITQITTKELQLNLNHELIPFFVVSKNELSGLKGIIAKNFPKQSGKSRFLEIDPKEAKEKLKSVYDDDVFSQAISKEGLINLNKYTYNKILNLFSVGNEEDNYSNYNKKSESPLDIGDITKKYSLGLSGNNKISDTEDFKKSLQNNEEEEIQKYRQKDEQPVDSPKEDQKEVSFDMNSCLEMQKKFADLGLDCSSLNKDYQEVSSFLEIKSKETIKNKNNLRGKSTMKIKEGEEDFINVKFSAAEESYPTIEKLTAQMMTRRDLAEKFERLKILEFETNLQKAENEMIQDILHDELYKVMASYGPAIEGMKEHVK